VIARNLYDNLAQQSDKSTQFSRQLISLLEGHADYVLNNPISDPNYKLQVANYLFAFGEKNKSFQILIDMAEQYPRNPYILGAVAILSTEMGENITALNVRNKIVEFDPWNAKNYVQLMLLYKEVGDIPNAEKMKDKILSFASSTPEAKFALEEFAK
jgi:Flp pilus assembly protein TadD